MTAAAGGPADALTPGMPTGAVPTRAPTVGAISHPPAGQAAAAGSPTADRRDFSGGGRLPARTHPGRWLFSPAPLARIAVLRVVVYLFVPVDLLLTTTWVRAHGSVPGELYAPLRLGRVLPLPTPGPWVEVFQALLVVAALAAAVAGAYGRWARVTGWLVAVLYLEWMVVAMSYGKVDHDRFAFLVALFVLPTVAGARLRSRGRTQAAGWALSMIALAVVATYTLAAVAKIRFGGWGWVDGSTLTWAVLRRNTPLSEPLLDVPVVLHAAQYGLLLLELVVAPLLLVRWRDPRLTWALAGLFLGFHVMTFSMITIIFLPHCVALLSLLPLEKLAPAPATSVTRPLAVFDIDGVLADVRHRLQHVERRPKDWDAFFAAAPEDPSLAEGVELARESAKDCEVAYVTGRPERCRQDTLDWFTRHGLPPGELSMRSGRDRRPARLVKPELLQELAAGREVAVVVDDDPQVCQAYEDAGFPVIHAEWMGRQPALSQAQEEEGRT